MTKHLFALILLSACTDPAVDDSQGAGGGKTDDPNAIFKDLTTSWELTVGHGGDAIVNDVTELTNGSMLVTSSYPTWLIKATADGERDSTFGSIYPERTTRTGSLDLKAHEVWRVGTSSKFVASVGDGLLYELDSFNADGTPNLSFGEQGRVVLPYADGDGRALLVAYDTIGRRFLVVVARGWELRDTIRKGPSKIEILAYDDKTGARSSAGSFDMPPWENNGTESARIHALVLRPDDSFALLSSETIDRDNPARSTSVATRWSVIRLMAGQPVELSELAVTDYGRRLAGFAELGAGRFDVYLSGVVDGVSTGYNEETLVRVSVDATGAPTFDAIGPGLDFRGGCPASVATPTALVFGHSPDQSKPIQFTAFPKGGGEPIQFESDRPHRCLTRLRVTKTGHIYAGTWDTTGIGWTAQLTKFE